MEKENDQLITNYTTTTIKFIPEIEHKRIVDELDKKIKNTEIQRDNVKNESIKLSLSIEKHLTEIKILREENTQHLQAIDVLKQDNANLRQEVKILKQENLELKEDVETLKQENLELKKEVKSIKEYLSENQTLINISQCVYDYKERIWKQIFQKDTKSKQRKILDLKQVFTGEKDNYLDEQQKSRRDNISNNIITKYKDIDIFFSYLGQMTKERNQLSHPDLSISDYSKIKPEFLNFCNQKWEEDEEINQIFTNDIFDVLLN